MKRRTRIQKLGMGYIVMESSTTRDRILVAQSEFNGRLLFLTQVHHEYMHKNVATYNRDALFIRHEERTRS